MTKNQLNDFAATLTAQLQDAAQQMRTMRKPPKHDDKKNHEHTTSPKTSKKKSTKSSKKTIKKEHISTLEEKNQTDPPTKLTEIPCSSDLDVSVNPDTHSEDCHLLSMTAQDSQENMHTPIDPPLSMIHTPMQKNTSTLDTSVSERNANLKKLVQIPEEKPSSVDIPPEQKAILYKEYTELQFSRLKDLIHTHTHNIQAQQASSTINKLSQTVSDYQLQQITPSENKEQTNIPWGHYNPHALSSVRLSTTALGGARQLILDALLQLHNESSQVTINLKRLATVLGLSYGTVRNTISRLVREGVIYTTQIRTGDVHGVHIEFSEMTPSLQSTTVTQHQKRSPYKTNIWDTDIETMTILWPHATAAGLCPAHFDLLKRAYLIQGFDATHLAKYLRYLNWKIETESFNDPIKATNLLQQWLQIMQQKGQYPCPTGYIEQTTTPDLY